MVRSTENRVLMSHTKNSSTRMGMAQAVTSIMARASTRRLTVSPTFSEMPEPMALIPSVSLDSSPDRKPSYVSPASCPEPSSTSPADSLADSTAASMDVR